MTWFDLLVVVLVLGYLLIGYWTGLIRRVIGFIGLYAGVYVATYMGHAAVGFLRTADSFLEVADARIYLWLGSVVVVVGVVELIATLYHQEVQVSLVALNNASGALVGAITGFAAAVLLWIVLSAAASPIGGSLTTAEVHIRQQVSGSYFGPKIGRAAGSIVQSTFGPVLPHNLDTYFGGSGARQ